MNTATTTGLDALKTTHLKVVHKTAETTGNVMRNKIAEIPVHLPAKTPTTKKLMFTLLTKWEFHYYPVTVFFFFWVDDMLQSFKEIVHIQFFEKL